MQTVEALNSKPRRLLAARHSVNFLPTSHTFQLNGVGIMVNQNERWSYDHGALKCESGDWRTHQWTWDGHTMSPEAAVDSQTGRGCVSAGKYVCFLPPSSIHSQRTEVGVSGWRVLHRHFLSRRIYHHLSEDMRPCSLRVD